jgi:ribosomal protein S4
MVNNKTNKHNQNISFSSKSQKIQNKTQVKKFKKPWVYHKYKVKKVRRVRYTVTWKRYKKIFTRRRVKRIFQWRKRKLRKTRRVAFNFSFFLNQQLSFRRKKRRRWKLVQSKAKDIYKKKIYFKKFLVRFYGFLKIKQLKTLVLKANKQFGFKVINFFLLMEGQLATTCLRMHLFWKRIKAKIWIKRGFVSLNNKFITSPYYPVCVHDLVRVSLDLKVWTKSCITMWAFVNLHSRRYKNFNSIELSVLCVAGIYFRLPKHVKDLRICVRRRRKVWIKTKVFSFLVNSFN